MEMKFPGFENDKVGRYIEIVPILENFTVVSTENRPQLRDPRHWQHLKSCLLFQVRDNDTVRRHRVLLSSICRHGGILGWVLQFSLESTHLRLLQPRIPRSLQENTPVLLSNRHEIEINRKIFHQESRQGLRHQQQRFLRRTHEPPAAEGQRGHDKHEPAKPLQLQHLRR